MYVPPEHAVDVVGFAEDVTEDESALVLTSDVVLEVPVKLDRELLCEVIGGWIWMPASVKVS